MASSHNLVALVTVLALLLYLWMLMRVGGARGRSGLQAPAVVGHPEFERHYRVQMNTLESLPLFLPSLWIFALYWDGRIAAALGLVWIIGRAIYMFAYVKEPKTRGVGFLTQGIATIALLLGSLAGIVVDMAKGGVG
jgi:uncharacterized MAPEG superfamily protein